MSKFTHLKSQVGCWLHERWKTELVLSGVGKWPWTALCNRIEILQNGIAKNARICCWQDATFLTVSSVFPKVGGRLLKHVSAQFPFHASTISSKQHGAAPAISVILVVGGADRTRQFSAALDAMRRQSESAIEILVIESGGNPLLKQLCPKTITYSFVKKGKHDEFNKAELMNLGASQAQSPLLLFHDADIVVPVNYVEQILSVINQGWEAVRPIRFLFCLDKVSSMRFITDKYAFPAEVGSIMQNFPGGSTAVSAETYWAIGGHDEQFLGWGGEDLEFLQRLGTRRLFAGSFMPAIHLWHPESPKKKNGDKNQILLAHMGDRPVQTRIDELCAKLNVAR